MFKGLGSWLGLEKPTETSGEAVESGQQDEEEKVVEAQNEVNKQQTAEQDPGKADMENPEQNKGLGGEKTFVFTSWVLFLWGR